MENSVLPQWAQAMADKNDSYGFHFLLFKLVDASDFSKEHYHFHINIDIVELEMCLIPYLTTEELEMSNLHKLSAPTYQNFWLRNLTNLKVKSEELSQSGHGESSSSGARRMHDGLNVSIYLKSGWKADMILTYNDECSSAIFMGKDTGILQHFGDFKEKDFVSIWAFRQPDFETMKAKLCFYIEKSTIKEKKKTPS